MAEIPYQLIDKADQLQEAVDAIKSESLMAMDCEGVSLSRDGSLTLLAIGTTSKSFLFDIMKIGPIAFEEGLRGVLESDTIVKLVFDCKGDADALWHLFKVKLANIVDIQLLQILYERKHPGEKSSSQKRLEAQCARYKDKSAGNRALFDWTRIRSLANCIEWYLEDPSLFVTKSKVSLSTPGADREMWGKRPITEDMQKYASIDVQTLFTLNDKFNGGLTSTEIETARKGSETSLNLFRDQPKKVVNPYENFSLLNMYILTDPPTSVTRVECRTCKRNLPDVDFKQGMCKLCQIKKWAHEDYQRRKGPVQRTPRQRYQPY